MVFNLSATATGPAQRPITPVSERNSDPETVLRNFGDAISARIRNAIPCSVVSWDSTKQTIVAQPLIREQVLINGVKQFIDLPQLLDVPVVFPQAGPLCLTFPITPGDEVLVIFADYCIDSWWALGGNQNWNDRRRHDLSDGIAIPGLNSVPNVIPTISSTAAELRTKDGVNKVSVDAPSNTITLSSTNLALTTSANMAVNIGGASTINLVGNAILNLTNNMTINIPTGKTLTINGDLVINGFHFNTHEHGGVTPGSGLTAGVVA